jgi:hypothetical protein
VNRDQRKPANSTTAAAKAGATSNPGDRQHREEPGPATAEAGDTVNPKPKTPATKTAKGAGENVANKAQADGAEGHDEKFSVNLSPP